MSDIVERLREIPILLKLIALGETKAIEDLSMRTGDAIAEIDRLRSRLDGAYEECAVTAECWRCEPRDDWNEIIRERMTRQNKVATEIAEAIRAKALRQAGDGMGVGRGQPSGETKEPS